ncbi:hypothetical protein ACK3ZF_20165 [Aeromonas caviae]
MAPNLVQNYRKQLDTDPEGMTDEVTFQHFMVSRRKQAILALTEYRMCNGSDFSFCLVVSELGVDEWLNDAIEDDSEWSEEELLAFVGEARTGKDIVVGRFVYNPVQLTISAEAQEQHGIQIRGAFIDPDYRSGLARQVYQCLRREYGCVVSDDMQTLDGAQLWLIGINQLRSQCIEIYDAQHQTIRGHLNYPIQPGNFKPWCLTGLTHNQITQESSSKFDVVDYAEQDDKLHILFLLR